jgi:hypothetical protein
MKDSRKELVEVTIEFLVEALIALVLTQMGLALPFIVGFLINLLIVKIVKVCYKKWLAHHFDSLFNLAIAIWIWFGPNL